jgi:hypothetical protein
MERIFLFTFMLGSATRSVLFTIFACLHTFAFPPHLCVLTPILLLCKSYCSIDIHHPCGNDDPGVRLMFESMGPTVTKSQLYHSEQQLAQYRRQLTDATYVAPFIPISALQAMGGTAPMRIKTVWDVMENGDKQSGGSEYYGCTVVGQDILAQNSVGTYVLTTGAFCETKHIVTGSIGAKRNSVVRSLTTRATNFFNSALSVRPILDTAITLDSSISNRFTINTTVVNDADLVIIMTARPSPNRPLSGFATCLQTDQYQRCTVGWFNWVPELLNVIEPESPDIIAYSMHTALHEFVHVFGGVGPAFSSSNSPFIDNVGSRLPMSSVYVVGTDAAYGNKPMTFIITPRVKNITRQAFGCSTMPGFPLEDLQLGTAHPSKNMAGLSSVGQHIATNYPPFHLARVSSFLQIPFRFSSGMGVHWVSELGISEAHSASFSLASIPVFVCRKPASLARS